MANQAAKTSTINIVPVQGIFQPEPTFDLVTLIGPAGTPFYANINPVQSGLTITNSTINSSVIGGSVPAAATFTNIATTTGTITATPSGPNDIVNQAYVDAVAQGLSFKQPANYTTLGNITLSGLAVQGNGDWVSTLTAGDRILVKNQTTGADNGIYVAAAGAWARSSDANTWNEIVSAYLFVLAGTVWAGSSWVDTNQQGGTLGTTPITFTQFSNNATYTAGTGLTLAGYQFSITPVGTAGTYGSASQVPVIVTNASGQVSSVTNTSIAITNTQVSGLGTMSTQNANAVAITGGTINGATIGATTAAAITGTTVTATSYFSGPGTNLTGTASGLSIGGNAATATSAGSVTNSLTINSGGSGGASPQTFNGGTAITISYNTVGAPSTTGTNASGTWGIGISGNAATVTNGLYSTGSYSNPTWLTSILGSIVSGAVATATTATNLAGGTTGALHYQSAASTSTFLALGTTNYVLTAGASAPQYVAQSTLSVGSATTATTATNLAGGGAGYVPYQSGAGATAFLAAGTTGQVFTSNGTSAPTWSTPISYATVTDDTTTAGTRYPLFANQTTGNLSTEYVSSTKLQYNPSTGVFTSTSFTGAGTGLTGTATSLSIGGNAATATSATSATTATNIAGGANGSVPYQTGSGATTFLAAGTNGYVMTLAGGVPTWAAAASSGITISDDTTTNATRYLTFTSATTGSITSENVSSTKLTYNPSTGNLSSTVITSVNDASISGLTVGKGGGALSSNTAVGISALAGANSGNANNTAVGQSALGNNTTGAYNSAFGLQALANNTTGQQLVSVGRNSLSQNTTGSYNTACGHDALANNSSASYNTAIGYQAGNALTTGAQNCVAGPFAGVSLTTGSYNSFVGGYGPNGASGAQITTGSKNSILGAYTGNYGGLDIRTASNYIVLSDGDGNPRQIIDSSGNVGIGTGTPGGKFTIVDNAGGSGVATTVTLTNGVDANCYLNLTGSSASDKRVVIGPSTGTAIAFQTNASERMRIDSSGNLLVGTTSNFSADKMCLNFTSAQNGFAVRDDSNSSGAYYAVFRNSANGVIGSITRVTTTNAVTYNTTSDQRLKSNIADASSVLNKLMNVKVRQFDWTEGNLHQDAGFIAQELSTVLSGIVTEGRTEDDLWQLDYARLTPYLTKAIQELKAINDTQAETINALTARIVALETK